MFKNYVQGVPVGLDKLKRGEMQFEFQKQKSREASAEESEHREFRKGVFGGGCCLLMVLPKMHESSEQTRDN